MLITLLNAAESIKGDGAAMSDAIINGILGQIVTFLGIVVLILLIALVGVIMKKFVGKDKKEENGKRVVKNQVKPAPDRKPEVIPSAAPDEIPAEVKVAIIAAISAYYEAEQPHAEFTVKRIKRI